MTNLYTQAWPLIRAVVDIARKGERIEHGARFAFDGQALIATTTGANPPILAFDHGWQSLLPGSDPRQVYLDLYLPLIATRTDPPLVLAQLGQSLDGFIATATGHSHFVTGPASIAHLHCLRALSDCVIVGAGTIAADNPRLTTRLVDGPNPARVVLDPQLRLPMTHGVFIDGQAPTLRVRARGVSLPPRLFSDNVEDLEIDAVAGKLDLRALLTELRLRGMRTVLVEGGGVTVSAFLAAQLIDRMHIVIAPFVIGEGRPGLRIPSPEMLHDCVRPPPRVFALGGDVLFDCDMRNDAPLEDVPTLIRRMI
ncbi:RibD family protein [Peristeroidobacter agariperforans]|uniref:RibD family protein n=1 Tax=Peristeroidobacter agariperforans TaxID=268404 RepID=UPI00101C9A72|nr:RibD family protein [Peristeroidobacter agariperforans]